MLTIIPDIHADLNRLEASLALVGKSSPAFLGDFIDAGKIDPDKLPKFAANDKKVLKRVRALIDRGEALAIMGNHELNAILFHRQGADGEPLRARNLKNSDQHKSFIEAFGIATPEALAWTDWFLAALPLWHEGQGFRLIHACWSDPEIAVIRDRRPDGRLHPEDLPEIAREDTDFGRAVKLITSGREVALPMGVSFHDKNGDERHHVRLSWWRKDNSWRGAALSVPDRNSLPDTLLPDAVSTPQYPESAPLVFVGHYKMDGAPRIESERVLCLDYPEAPCIYLWKGEAQLSAEHVQTIPAHKIALANNPLISTGWGVFIFNVIFRTSRADAEAVQKEMGLYPLHRAEDSSGAYFTWSPTGVKRGDDETIVWKLHHALPKGIHANILWDESNY